MSEENYFRSMGSILDLMPSTSYVDIVSSDIGKDGIYADAVAICNDMNKVIRNDSEWGGIENKESA